MEGEWKLVRLGDHVDSCLGKMLDKNKNRGTLHPYLGNKNVRWGRFELQNLSQMKFQEDEHDRYGLLSGDLTVCEGGEPGRCAIWKNEVSGMKIQKALHRIRPLDGLNNIYLYYWFVFSANNGLLDPFFTGTTIKHLTGKSLADLQLPLPPLSEQKRIAYILGSLDDKIELNRQMNATLEGMAQALFKSWFVDFDPVIDNALAAGNPIPEAFAARAETRRKALAHGSANREVAKQFPPAFQLTDEMGWIPEGWEIKQWKEIAKLEYGKSLKGYRDGEGTIPVFGTNGLIGLTDKTLCNDEGIIIGRKGAYRGVHYSSVPFYVIDTAFYLAPIIQVSKKWAYYEILRFDINGMDSGSAIPSTSRDDFYSLWSILPSPMVQTEFDRIISLFYTKKKSNNIANYSLVNLRDTLLPKLISGEIRIPEAEKLTEEALA